MWERENYRIEKIIKEIFQKLFRKGNDVKYLNPHK